MVALGWYIAAGVYAVYAMAMVFVVKVVINSSLKYLNHPPVNFLQQCRAAARYDMVNLNPTTIYIGALFIFPFRLVFQLIFILLTYTIVLIIKLSFCGRNGLT